MQSEEQLWDLDTFPIALHSTATSSFQLLHTATWTPTVDKHAKLFISQRQAEWLSNFSDARSTDFTLLEDNGREILGQVLADSTIQELVIQDLLQASSFCFPTTTVVSRNHCGSWSTKSQCNCATPQSTLSHTALCHALNSTVHNTPCMMALPQP
eukprot:3169103-Rhodomonas_salina.2